MAWKHRSSIAVVLAAGALAATRAGAVTEPPPDPIRLGLYEWMAVAPIVVAADVLVDDGKYIQAMTREPIKGAVPARTTLYVDLKRANRDRAVGVKALDLARGRGYLLLLEAAPQKASAPSPLYDLVRGISGAREIPKEAPGPLLEAAAKLADIQERKTDSLLWSSVPEFLEDPNPVLVDAALELVVKFRKETLDLLPSLTPLLESPRPDVRQRAVVLIGRVLVRQGAEAVPERSTIVAEITGRARRDDDVEVRRAATAAISTLADAGVDETLKTISHDDPDQNVRFEAEKALYERKLSGRGGGTD
ncbi:MAG TPA: HEAT repeat domain-containing protein [Candidatus Polarisedimenticolaceae bacterium]|nr:HEAT repeat domain-containing protein [Candidatus Polarisedimenticolaceae bacterium]